MYMHDFGYDTHESIEWARRNSDFPVYAVAIYLIIVFYVPEHLSAPFDLRQPWRLWNLLLALFSICGAAHTVPHLAKTVADRGVAYTLCEPPEDWYLVGPVGMWVSFFIFSKIPELLDTVFLVFQKKEVIFLHWFHHVTVLLYCWHAYTTNNATGLWFCAINYSVHSVMYLYYFLSISGGALRTYARPMAPMITTIQLAQMVVGCGVTVGSGLLSARGPCAVDPSNVRLGFTMYLSYFVLFAMLFYNLYLKKGGKHARKPREGEAETLCGVDLNKGDASGFFHGARRPNVNDAPEGAAAPTPAPASPPAKSSPPSKRITRSATRATKRPVGRKAD